MLLIIRVSDQDGVWCASDMLRQHVPHQVLSVDRSPEHLHGGLSARTHAISKQVVSYAEQAGS